MEDIIVKNSGIVRIGVRRDSARGDLFFAEAAKHIPFEIKRIYFIKNLSQKSGERGGHAHRTQRQAIFCMSGSFVLNLDDGERKQSVVLDAPSYGILLEPKLWHTMSDFSNDCLIFVCADGHYDEADYIRHYPDFLAHVREA